MSGDPYELLEVDRNSTIEEIRQKYYELKWSYDCRKELGKLEKDKEDEFNNITKAYHELLTDEHHLILSGYPIALAINSTDKSLTEEEIEDILQKNDIALQELQDQKEKEVEEKFKKLDLAFQEIKEEQEYEIIEKRFKRIDKLSSIIQTKERIKLIKQEIKQLGVEIELLKESAHLFRKEAKLYRTQHELLVQKRELLQQLREKNVPLFLNEEDIEQKKKENEQLSKESEQLSEEIKLLVKSIKLSRKWTELLETETELSEQLSELRTRCELKASYQTKSKIFMASTGVFIIAASIIAVLFSMNLVSSEIMLPSTITSAALSLMCVGFAIYYSNQAFTEVDTKLLNSTDQLNIEQFSQNKEIPSCG